MECGIEYLFCNLGTDHVGLIEAMAQFKRLGRPQPRVVLCPHENVALHRAGGYATVTGRGQDVLVHMDGGTANAAMGMHKLFRSRLPVPLMAGRAPFTLRGGLPGARANYVDYLQDPFDIGSLVRPYVKWSLPSGVVTKEVLRRAHTVMQSDPPGPVYLTLPRATLAETWAPGRVASFPAQQHGAVRSGGLSAEQAGVIAQRLMRAERPVAITAYLGLLLDIDLPWLPRFASPDAATDWLQIDVDRLKKDSPCGALPPTCACRPIAPPRWRRSTRRCWRAPMRHWRGGGRPGRPASGHRTLPGGGGQRAGGGTQRDDQPDVSGRARAAAFHTLPALPENPA